VKGLVCYVRKKVYENHVCSRVLFEQPRHSVRAWIVNLQGKTSTRVET
jgi:hypothetical protein